MFVGGSRNPLGAERIRPGEETEEPPDRPERKTLETRIEMGKTANILTFVLEDWENQLPSWASRSENFETEYNKRRCENRTQKGCSDDWFQGGAQESREGKARESRVINQMFAEIIKPLRPWIEKIRNEAGIAREETRVDEENIAEERERNFTSIFKKWLLYQVINFIENKLALYLAWGKMFTLDQENQKFYKEVLGLAEALSKEVGDFLIALSKGELSLLGLSERGEREEGKPTPPPPEILVYSLS